MAKYLYRCGRGHETLIEQKMAEYTKVITCEEEYDYDKGLYATVEPCEDDAFLVPQLFTFHVE